MHRMRFSSSTYTKTCFRPPWAPLGSLRRPRPLIGWEGDTPPQSSLPLRPTLSVSRSPISPLISVQVKRWLHLRCRSASDDASAQHQQQLLCDDLKYRAAASVSGTARSTAATTTRGGHQQRERGAAAVFRRDTMPPIHLMSATNEVRSGLVLPQRLPLKLASSRPRWTAAALRSVLFLMAVAASGA